MVFHIWNDASLTALNIHDLNWLCVLCMYVMIGKRQIAQNRLKNNIKGKYKYLVVFWKLADPVPVLLQVVNGSST